MKTMSIVDMQNINAGGYYYCQRNVNWSSKKCTAKFSYGDKWYNKYPSKWIAYSQRAFHHWICHDIFK